MAASQQQPNGALPLPPPQSPQQFCLRWNNYQTNLTNVFDQLLQSESFVDVTLACEGHSVKAHKMVLSACSPYFQSLFFDNPCQHPIVILKDIKWTELKAAVEFMYKGEINVSQDQIGPLLKVAETLKIRGLADVNGEQELGRTGDDGVSVSRKKRRRSSGDDSAAEDSLSESLDGRAPLELVTTSPQPPQTPQLPTHSALLSLPLPPPPPPPPPPSSTANSDEMEIKPGIAEMIREEERMKNLLYGTNGYSSYSKAKMLESTHAWLGASTSSLTADSYQYQLQSMWQKCWNTNQSLVHNLRFRERGPLKSWRPETMAEAILSVLKEGLSLSQAARKYDIPYPTFVLYANRVHNMLGPSADGGSDLRPKGRGRPQRILLGIWPEEHIRGVIRAVVFRDPQHIKEETINLSYPRMHEAINYSTSGGNPGGAGGPVNLASTMGANMGGGMGANLAMGGGGMPGSLGGGMGGGLAGMPSMGGGGSNMPGGGSDAGGVSPNTAAAAMVAVAQGLRQQMLAAHHHHGGGDHHLPPAPSYIPSNHLLPTHSPLASPVDSSPTSSPNTNIDHNYNLSSQQQEKMDSRCLKNSLADWVALKANMAMGYKQVLNDNVNSARADHLFQDEIEDLVKRPQSNDSTKSKVSMGVSGVPYKSDCQGYATAPSRTESLFQDSEIEDLVKSPQPSQPKEQPIHIPTIDQRTE